MIIDHILKKFGCEQKKDLFFVQILYCKMYLDIFKEFVSVKN